MKTLHIIKSTEYHGNQSSFFAFYRGQYYGCLLYPEARNRPQDLGYWDTATSSDEGRGFAIGKVKVTESELAQIFDLQLAYDSNQSICTSDRAFSKPFEAAKEAAYVAIRKILTSKFWGEHS